MFLKKTFQKKFILLHNLRPLFSGSNGFEWTAHVYQTNFIYLLIFRRLITSQWKEDPFEIITDVDHEVHKCLILVSSEDLEGSTPKFEIISQTSIPVLSEDWKGFWGVATKFEIIDIFKIWMFPSEMKNWCQYSKLSIW